MKFRTIQQEADYPLVESLFAGDTSGQVAPPNPIWWTYVTSSDNVRCILHFENERPAAITQFDIEERVASISVFIREDLRGRGLFNSIITDAITLLPPEVRTINAYISEANHHSVSAFQKFGFEGNLNRDEDGLLIFTFDLQPRTVDLS